MGSYIPTIRLLAMTAFLSLGAALGSAQADDASRARGQYLVTFGGCNDCHTPGYFLGKADESRYLGGSDVAFFIPGLGSFVGPNLTPDKETGLGNWSQEQIVTAFQTGVTPDGRILAPVMPWHAFAHLTSADANAIADYLQSLPPVSNQVPGPFGPDEKPTVAVMKVSPPEHN